MKKIITTLSLSVLVLCSFAQYGLKAIKINHSVELTSGVDIPSGSIIVINEGYANINGIKDSLIPSQVSAFVYASLSDYNSGKQNIPSSSIKDFNPNFNSLKMDLESYTTLPTQDLLISIVYKYLYIIYPGSIEVITL